VTVCADEDVQKFMFDGHLPRHRQSTVSSTSKSAASMLTAKAAQIKMEEWKQRLQPKSHVVGRDGADEFAGENEQQVALREQNDDGLLAHHVPPATAQFHDPTEASDAAAVHTVDDFDSGSFDANAKAAAPGAVKTLADAPGAVKTLAAEAADAAAEAFAAIGAASRSVDAATLHATNSHLAPASSQEQHAPLLLPTGPSRSVPGAKHFSVVKLGTSGVRTFHGVSPSMSPVHIRLPKASPVPPPPPPSGQPSPHVAIAFGSSLRRTLKSPSPASSLVSSLSHQRTAAERPIKPSSPQAAQSASIDRITAPTIASELRTAKSTEGDAGSGSSIGRPVVLGFRDALLIQRRSAEDGVREAGSDAGKQYASQ
jgi:hypothetical protein